MAIVGPPEPVELVLTSGCRDLRRALAPVAWTVLEEVVLDATADCDRIVAATSARRIAAQLELDSGTVASALRVLRGRGLLELERLPGPTGRFGLSSYVVDAPGIRIVQPCGDQPHVGAPSTVSSRLGDPTPRPDRPSPAAGHPHEVADGQAAFNLDW